METATPGVWEMCWDYLRPDDDEPVWRRWCTTTDDPQPPPNGPGPPPPGFPDDYEGLGAQLFYEGGTGGCWLTFPPDPPEFLPTIGPWGGWGVWFTGVGLGDLFLEIYPVAWDTGVITWRCRWEVVGGGTGFKDMDQAAGFSPNFDFGLGGIPDCAFSDTVVLTTVPP